MSSISKKFINEPLEGGGSGHEPYAAGYVGRGMLTAAVSGDVFASLPSRHRIDRGSILFIINYTGDRLNFGLAAERYLAAGHHVKMISIADDVAIESLSNTVERRGLAAAVLIIKVGLWDKKCNHGYHIV
ncbi:hypothetical protein KIN20_009932 [Parelaphostrongylus tenuis]|uniref:DhaK domain-containing protein n=1 Tax=Parelaphostrongylus tenuis TaxID=148309 RepID=A0AAD5MSK2_PARTN|nr:hypothetical protein KIN20_009932 [Parelaphostrongylus tenuis]